MKCPRCGWISSAAVPACPGCDFSLAALDRVLGAPPAPLGAIDDAAGVLSDAGRERLARRLAEIEARTGGPVSVVTRVTTAPARPAEYAFWLFNHGRSAAHGERGLLVLLALREKRIETEVGSGWADRANDPATGRVLDRDVVPLLRVADWDGALLQAVESLAALVGPAEVEPR